MKFNAGQKTTNKMEHDVASKKAHPMQSHHTEDESKMEDARKGNFGGKSGVKESIERLQEKFPGVQVTHRHNSTVR